MLSIKEHTSSKQTDVVTNNHVMSPLLIQFIKGYSVNVAYVT